MPSLSHRDLTHLGMDVHKDSISVGILRPDEDSPDVERIFNDEPSVRRLLARFEDPRRISVCYGAGPTGYELHRLLTAMGIRCQVIAPSLIPRSAGDRVKTDMNPRPIQTTHDAGTRNDSHVFVPSPGRQGMTETSATRRGTAVAGKIPVLTTSS